MCAFLSSPVVTTSWCHIQPAGQHEVKTLCCGVKRSSRCKAATIGDFITPTRQHLELPRRGPKLFTGATLHAPITAAQRRRRPFSSGRNCPNGNGTNVPGSSRPGEETAVS